MLNHGFEDVSMNCIYLRVYETNLRGMRSFEKVVLSVEAACARIAFWKASILMYY